MLRVLHRVFRLEPLPIFREDRAGSPPFCLSSSQRSRPTFYSDSSTKTMLIAIDLATTLAVAF